MFSLSTGDNAGTGCVVCPFCLVGLCLFFYLPPPENKRNCNFPGDKMLVIMSKAGNHHCCVECKDKGGASFSKSPSVCDINLLVELGPSLTWQMDGKTGITENAIK